MINKIKSSVICKIAYAEMQVISKRKLYIFFIIILPFILFIHFSLVYSNKVVSQIPIAIMDNDNSEISRLIIRAAGSTRSMKIEKYITSIDEIKEEMLRGNINGAIVIPANCESDIKSGKPATLTIYKNTSNLIIGNLILKDGLTISKMISAGIQLKKIRSRGLSEEQAMNIINPIRIETNVLFNPGYNYLDYLVTGLLPATLQMLIMVVASIAVPAALREKRFLEILKISKNGLLNIISGISIPYILLFSCIGLSIIGIVYPLFNIPLNGSIIFLVFFMLLFIMASFSMGFFISCIFKNNMIAIEAVIFLNTPGFIFSGYTFPLWAMPKIFQYAAHIFPFTHYMTGFQKITQFGAPVKYAVPEVIYLTIFIFGSILLSWITLKLKTRNIPLEKDLVEEIV